MAGDGSFNEGLSAGLIRLPEPTATISRAKDSRSASRITQQLERMGAGTGRRSVYEGLARVHTNLTSLRDTSLPDSIEVEDDVGEDEAEEEDYGPHSVVDRCFENQRGWFLFGFPFFSANSLMPVDPKPWTSDKGVAISGDASSYLLPDVTWRWAWKRWYVDMSLDVDDQGWAYSWRFGSRSWHGSHLWLQSFVRRRAWIRKREKAPRKDAMALFKHGEDAIPFDVRPALSSSRKPSSSMVKNSSEAHSVSELELALENARLDRERIAILVKFMHDERNMHAMWTIANEDDEKYIAAILESFKYADSKAHLIANLQKPAAFPNPEHEEVYRLLTDNFQDVINQTGYYNPKLFILKNT